MISIRELGYAHDESTTIRNISLEIAAGENMALMGANGAGKTTLLKLIAGLYTPDTGRVRRDGVVGFAPEDPTAGLFADTVEAEIKFFPENRGLDATRSAVDVMRALDIYHLRDRNPYTLSVGEQRRVSIASVLAGDPAIVALDEPTAGVDRHGERELATYLGDIDATVVFSTHESDFAYDIADRVAVLHDGALDRVDEAKAVLADESCLRDAGIRTPGIVAWARQRGVDHPPSNFQEAVRILKGEQ